MATTTRVDENGRVCTQCYEYKLWFEFYIHCNGVNGRSSRCKDC